MGRLARRLLIAEGDTETRALLRRTLQQAFDACQVAEAENLESALEQAGGQSFETVVVGSSILGQAGQGTLARVVAASPESGVVVVAPRGDWAAARSALEGGEADFVVSIDDVHAWLPGAVKKALAIAELRARSQQIERELEATERHFRLVFNDSRDAVFILRLTEDGVAGKFTHANRWACQSLGYTTAQLLKLSPLDICAPEHATQAAATLARVLREKTVLCEIHHLSRNGARIPVQINAHLCDLHDRLSVLWIARDLREQKQALAEVERCRSLFDATLDATADGILIVDRQDRIVGTNRRFVDLWQVPEAVVGSRDAGRVEMFVRDQVKDPETFLMRLRSLDAQPDIETYDVLELTDGRTFERYSGPQRVGGEVVGRVHSFRDVTKYRRAEAQLRYSEETARALLNATADAAVLTDVEGTILALNEPFAQTFGARADPLIGSCLWDVLPSELAAERMERLREGIWSGKPVHFEDQWGDRYLDNRIDPLFDGRGNVERLALRSRDITAQKQTEAELKDLLQLNQVTLATVPSSLLVLDADLNVLMANQRYLDGRGLEPSDVIGENLAQVFSEALLAEQNLWARVRAVAANGGHDELVTVKHTSSDHEDRYLNIRICGFPIAGERSQEQACVLLVLDNVTQQRTLEEQVRQTSQLESIGALAGGVAHDFNNILTGIMGYASMALQLVPEGAPVRDDLKQIHGLAERAAGLTRQLLAFGRRQPLEPRVLNLNNLVKDLATMVERIIGEDIQMRLSLAPDLDRVRADEGQIEQMLMNLVANARDAMPQGGVLSMETANVVLDQEHVDAHLGVTPGPHVMIAVSDTGCGIDEATRQRIFEPFFTTKQVGKGTGLGLATVYGIIKQHEGHVWVYSESGQGTTFKIYLPRVDGPPQPPKDRAPEMRMTGGTETVLLVEDEEAVRDIARRVLQDQGYSVFCAASPDEAKELFAQHGGEIDLLVSDVVMPGMTGPALYEWLSATDPYLKALYLSGYTEHAAVRNCVSVSGVSFLPKPLTPAVLVRKVREVLDG